MAKAQNKSVAKSQDKNNREPIIKEKIQSFCQKHLNDEFEGYAINLYETLGRKRKINISRGKKEIWAASIIYVIARLNFLFDKDQECHITPDMICDFFGTVKTTVANKAGVIEKECGLRVGAEGYCSPEITKSLTFYQTSEGFIVPGSYFDDDDEEFDEEEETFLEQSEIYQMVKEVMMQYCEGDPETEIMDDEQLYNAIMTLLNKFYELEEGTPEQIQLFQIIMMLISDFGEEDDDFADFAIERANKEDLLKIQAFVRGMHSVIEEEMKEEAEMRLRMERAQQQREKARLEKLEKQRKKREEKRRQKELEAEEKRQKLGGEQLDFSDFM